LKHQEAKTGEINLPEDNPETVRLVLHYLYHLDYPHIFPDGKDEESDAVVFGGGSPDWGSYPPVKALVRYVDASHLKFVSADTADLSLEL
jgi:hypothetical protein